MHVFLPKQGWLQICICSGECTLNTVINTVSRPHQPSGQLLVVDVNGQLAVSIGTAIPTRFHSNRAYIRALLTGEHPSNVNITFHELRLAKLRVLGTCQAYHPVVDLRRYAQSLQVN